MLLPVHAGVGLHLSQGVRHGKRQEVLPRCLHKGSPALCMLRLLVDNHMVLVVHLTPLPANSYLAETMCRAALDTLISCGVPRVLTSGGAHSALQVNTTEINLPEEHIGRHPGILWSSILANHFCVSSVLQNIHLSLILSDCHPSNLFSASLSSTSPHFLYADSCSVLPFLAMSAFLFISICLVFLADLSPFLQQFSLAAQGSTAIRQLVEQAQGRITVMAGGGVRAKTAELLVSLTGVSSVHASASGWDSCHHKAPAITPSFWISYLSGRNSCLFGYSELGQHHSFVMICFELSHKYVFW